MILAKDNYVRVVLIEDDKNNQKIVFKSINENYAFFHLRPKDLEEFIDLCVDALVKFNTVYKVKKK